jgi:hypothetical protein
MDAPVGQLGYLAKEGMRGYPGSVVPSQSRAARRAGAAAAAAALTVFMMKGELQRVLQQGPEHAVGRRDKGGVQGELSGHFLHRDALNCFFV